MKYAQYDTSDLYMFQVVIDDEQDSIQEFVDCHEDMPAAVACTLEGRIAELQTQFGWIAPDRAVQVGDRLGAVAVQLAHHAAFEAGRGLGTVLRVQYVAPLFGCFGYDGPAVQVEYVGQNSSQRHYGIGLLRDVHAPSIVHKPLSLPRSVASPHRRIARDDVWRRAVVTAPKRGCHAVAHAPDLAALADHIPVSVRVRLQHPIELLGKSTPGLEWILPRWPWDALFGVAQMVHKISFPHVILQSRALSSGRGLAQCRNLPQALHGGCAITGPGPV